MRGSAHAVRAGGAAEAAVGGPAGADELQKKTLVTENTQHKVCNDEAGEGAQEYGGHASKKARRVDRHS